MNISITHNFSTSTVQAQTLHLPYEESENCSQPSARICCDGEVLPLGIIGHVVIKIWNCMLVVCKGSVLL